jgi:hypothetical protein
MRFAWATASRVNPYTAIVVVESHIEASMDTTMSNSRALASEASARVKDAHAPNSWDELVAAMPIVILYRAAREVFRQRAHKRAVLEAFRR